MKMITISGVTPLPIETPGSSIPMGFFVGKLNPNSPSDLYLRYYDGIVGITNPGEHVWSLDVTFAQFCPVAVNIEVKS